uniref:SGS domain-containing protein n=1 Tax=Megaselia scalaris TaxID=36166 RepID=T1GKC6_MEGSC
MSTVKHEFYQTDKKIVVSVLLKDAANKNPQITIEPETLKVTANEHCNLTFNLFGKVVPEKSNYNITAYKIEISLKKETAAQWDFLERKIVVPKSNTTPGQKNWDRLAKEIEDQDNEEKKGEDQLNDMFKKIYGDASPEVRMAMNKSYSESGGTVLSTNWSEVKSKKVEVKPPDGVEFREWEK